MGTTLSKLRPISAPEFAELALSIASGEEKLNAEITAVGFASMFHDWITQGTMNRLDGLDLLEAREACVGVTHQIDSLIMRHGEHGLQILEHDYAYYRRLWPHKEWTAPGYMIPKKPMIIACPFPGYGRMHPLWDDILAEAKDKDIDLHLDCAWLTAAKGVNIDLSHACIKTVTISLSKGLCLDWNRIGVRYSKAVDPTDPITIANAHEMINRMDLAVGAKFMERFPADHLWSTWGDAYHRLCKDRRLRPTDCIHMALELGTNKPVGTQDLLTF